MFWLTVSTLTLVALSGAVEAKHLGCYYGVWAYSRSDMNFFSTVRY